MKLFSKCRKTWLNWMLEAHNSIPSHDTSGRVFVMKFPRGILMVESDKQNFRLGKGGHEYLTVGYEVTRSH